MKFLYYILLYWIIFLNSCKSIDNKNQNSLVSNTKENAITGVQPCKAFIDSFPNDFKSFNDLYGYDDNKGPNKLYNQYEFDIKHFFSCKLNDESSRIIKTVNISLNGSWEADAVGLFQDGAIALLKRLTSDFVKYLNTLSEIQCASFWSFILDGSPPNDTGLLKEYNELMENISYDSRQSDILKTVFNKIK